MGYYRKNYLCICEGQQEKMYLDHVATLIKNFPEKVVKFNSYIDKPQRLNKIFEEYDCGVLFDFDFNIKQFEENIKLCDEKNKKQKPKNKRQHVYHAYSNVNFDLWLILHKKMYNKEVSGNDAYVKHVKKIYNLNSNDNIKKEEIIKKILDQISLNDVKSAIERADTIRNRKLETDAITIGKSKIFTNPDFSLHEFLKIVLKDSGDL